MLSSTVGIKREEEKDIVEPERERERQNANTKKKHALLDVYRCAKNNAKTIMMYEIMKEQ